MSNYSTEKEDEKKGGAVPPWMTGSARVGSGLSSGGAGQAGSMLAKFGALLAGPKAIVTATVLGGMALGMGVVSTIKPPEQPSLAQRFNKEKVKTGSPSGALPGMEGGPQSALNMAQAANAGFYGDPNASAQAPETAQADAPADTPSDPATDAPVDEAAAAAGQQNPAEMAAALTGKQNTKSGIGGGKFGKLSSGLGGGLAGGAGLSGGIGGSFKQANLTNSRAGDLRSFQGANRASVTRGKLSSNNLGKSALKGATAKRLDNMNRAMGQARLGNAETGAATHAAQWDAASPSGNAITGAGANGIAGGGQFSGEEGLGGGGPLDTQTNSGSTSANDVKDIDNGKNVTQYQSQLDMAKGMLMLASAIIAIVGIICMVRNAAAGSIIGSPVAAALTATMKVFIGIAIGLAVAAAAIGASIGSQYGQGQQGQIIAVGGGITAAAGAAALLIPQMPVWVMVLGGIAGMAIPLMGGGGGKTADRSDIDANG